MDDVYGLDAKGENNLLAVCYALLSFASTVWLSVSLCEVRGKNDRTRTLRLKNAGMPSRAP